MENVPSDTIDHMVIRTWAEALSRLLTRIKSSTVQL